RHVKDIRRRIRIKGNQLVGTVYSVNPSAAFFEFGFSGVENVKARFRETMSGQKLVKRYQRTVVSRARPAILPALAESQDQILSEIKQGIAAALEGKSDA